MPVHPQAQRILDAGKLLSPMETLTVAAARQRCMDTFCTGHPPEKIRSIQDRILDLGPDLRLDAFQDLGSGPFPDRIPVRIYTPDGQAPQPVLVYFHGGGFVVNNLDTHDGICRNLANRAGSIVVSVDYSRAPEFRFPAALLQCYKATAWVARNAAQIGGDPHRIAVGGDSSGGTLAAGVTLMARDMGAPPVCFQLLIYPALDDCLPGTLSYRKFSTGYSLTLAIMKWFFDHYLPGKIDKDTPYLFPARSKSLENLPGALIITAEYDPLRDEGEEYAFRLEKAGSDVTLKRYEGMIHGFIIMHRAIDRGKQALEEAGEFLKNRFASLGESQGNI
ncbi:alpha/beta hydrolase [Desulfospira joergensenii]|uniref:alpha/beta hydrolase n=1 Tax=Desulfospira joergensenii TaxID=53329 RepID=UPI0003B55B83|nr:alpha/beta hydrolase [Desulfospira joergensenii]